MKVKTTEQKLKSTKAKNKSTDSNSASSIYLWLAAIVIVTAVIYFPMLKNEFTSWDDKEYVVDNPYVKNLNAENIKHMFTAPIANNYHPFAILSLALNYNVSQLNPFSYFLVNLLLHLANIVLIFFFIQRLCNNKHVAVFSALLFAIHPMHVESVAWISERKDVLYAFFFFAGLITYLIYLENKKPLYYALTLILALFSMFSKPAAIIFPLALIAIDFYKTSKIDVKFQLNKIPFFLLAAFFMYMTWIAQQQNNALVADFKTFNIFERFLFACYGLIIYVVKFFIPLHLAPFHPYPDTVTWLYYLMPLFAGAICVFIYFYKPKQKLLLFGFLFYTINLILVLQFVSIGAALYAERYTYMSYTGLFFVAGMLLFEKQNNISSAWIATLIISAVFSFLAFQRVNVWHNSETLWTDQIEKYPEQPRGYYDRAIYYNDNGMYDKAIADYNTAIKNKPEYKSYANRGVVYLTLKDYDKAFSDFQSAYLLDSTKHEALAGLAQYFNAKGQFEPALKYITRSIEIKSTYEAHFTKAAVLKGLKMYKEAVDEYRITLSINDNPSARFNLANIFFINLSDFQNAVKEYDTILKTDPDYTNAATYKGLALYQLNKYNEAIVSFNMALRTKPDDVQALAYRSMAFMSVGEKQNAINDAVAAQKLGYAFGSDYLQKLK